MNGIPPEITDRAEHLARLAARGEDLVAACMIMSDKEIEELQGGVSLTSWSSDINDLSKKNFAFYIRELPLISDHYCCEANV